MDNIEERMTLGSTDQITNLLGELLPLVVEQLKSSRPGAGA